MGNYVIPTGEYIYLHSLTLDGNNINLYCTNEMGEKFTLIYNKKDCQNLLSFLKIEDLANNELMKMVELDEPQKIEIARKYISRKLEVRHEQWIPLKGWFNKSIVKCSVCGNTLDMDGVNAGRGDANFCPNCGARMDVDIDNT